MGRPYIINPDTSTPVDPAELFGKDAKRLLEACDKAFHNWLPSSAYKECYRSPSRPTLGDARKIHDSSKGEPLGATYKSLVTEWETSHPEEVAKEQLSRKEWEANRDKQFRIIYGIARRHGLYLDWHGNNAPYFPDRWDVYKDKERIARIFCM